MPIEDFTTYTEADPGADVTVDSNTVSWDDLNCRNTDSYVYRDKGVGYYDGDFVNRFIIERGADIDNGAIVYHWVIANVKDDFQAFKDDDRDAAGIRVYYSTGSSSGIYLNLIEAGEQLQDGWAGSGIPAAGTPYYITVKRDDSAGANNTGRYTVRICTVAHYGEDGAVLQDTLSLDCSADCQFDFQYVYGLCSLNYGDNYYCDGYTEDMEATVWVRPTSHVDDGGEWTDETSAYDDEIIPTTYAYSGAEAPGGTSDYLEFYCDSIQCDRVRVWVDVDTAGDITETSFAVWWYADGGWHGGLPVYSDDFAAYTEVLIGSIKDVTGIMIRFGNSELNAENATGWIYDVALGKKLPVADVPLPVLLHHLRQQKIA